jgi:isopenicillin N synthase-like dioxygenase
MEIPVVDLSQNEQTIIDELMNAFTTIGFCTLINHSKDASFIDQAFQASKQFFELPLSTKQKYAYTCQKSNRGYIAYGQETHDRPGIVQPDVKETMDIGYQYDSEYQNKWPEELPDNSYKDILLDYFERMDKLFLKMLEYLALGLGLPRNYLVQKCNNNHENLRLLHYPRLSDPDRVRGNIHSDFGVLTLLVQDSVGGLKVQHVDGTWISLEPRPGSIVVNVGDMLMRWSNDTFKATLHCVMPPPKSGEGDGTTTEIPERYSIAFFCNANRDTIIECLEPCCNDVPAKYPPINAHEYLTGRLTATINAESQT